MAKARAQRRKNISRKHKLHGKPIRKDYHKFPTPTREMALKHWDQILSNLIALAKGKVDAKSGQWFYRLFFGYKIPMPSTLEGIRQALEDAYWIEEEDIKQEILLIVWKHKYTYRLGYWLKFNIARDLRTWLVTKGKVFRHPDNWRDQYQQWIIEEHYNADDLPDISVVLDPPAKWSGKTMFDRYFLYLSNILDLQRQEISDILITTVRQVNRFKLQIKELEDAY